MRIFEKITMRFLQKTTMAICVTVLSTFALAEQQQDITRAAVPQDAIEHIMVIDLENESFADTFGPYSPADYLNNTLLSQGQLLTNYFGTSHVSMGNYLSQVSGQAPTVDMNNDCIDLVAFRQDSSHIVGAYNDITPGTPAADQERYPGQVVGNGCVFPASVKTIGDQLDAKYADRSNPDRTRLNWRQYAEDMGNDPSRDYGTPDFSDGAAGGTTCAHPVIGEADLTNSAAENDQYADRHNPFVYFHSVIDDQARCDTHVVPMGKLTVGQNGKPDTFAGHLYEDLRFLDTTPRFMFVTPNLCNDGHDHTCAGLNVEGGHEGGLVSADLWLKHWMPMIFNSPAYQSGKMLVVLTFDEADPLDKETGDLRACSAENQADCHSPTGPNVSNPGYSSLLTMFYGLDAPAEGELYKYAGGGRIGAVLFNKKYIEPGSTNDTDYNHYSALRSYEDLLGLTTGGDDGFGHLGYASNPHLKPFGVDVFNR